MQAAKNYTKHVCDFRKGIKKQYLARTTLNSLHNQLQIASAHLKIANIIQSSTDIMHTLNSTLKLDSISSVMAEMGKEMMKAGLIEEIISDGLEDATEVDTTDEEVNLELEKIMNDVALSTTTATAGGAYVPTKSNIAVSTPIRTEETAATVSPGILITYTHPPTDSSIHSLDDELYQQMKARLDGL